VAAPLLAYLMSMYVFQSYRVDGESMEATLQNNDRLIVWKLGRTWSGIRGKTYMPEREQIIVFAEKLLPDSNGKPKSVIKRVVGLPGDRVTVKDGKVTVYTPDKPGGYNPDENETFSSQIQKPTEGNIDVTVPEGHVFVLGDNRPNSLDSRYFGTVPTEDIRGTASLRIAPINNMTNL
jgi:signal peptidase I